MAKQIDLKALLESKMGEITPLKEAKTALNQVEMKIPRNLMFDAESTEFKPETKPVTATVGRGLTVEEAKSIDDDMNRFIDMVLIEGIDYGLIPHCPKPTLFKSGAEKILKYLGLIARTEIVNRVEDYNTAFFSYEAKVYLIDYNGVVKGEGIGITNSKEGKYAKSNGFSVQNVVLKMAKKRALVDATLNVGNLSARFTQDVEDMNMESDRNVDSSKQKTDKPATKNQIAFLEKLMKESNSSAEAVNHYLQKNYNVDNYQNASSLIISTMIEKFKSVQ